MVEPQPTAQIVALRDARERAISQLSDAFAHDLIGVDEFERRLTLAHRANSPSEVTQTVADLVAPASSTALAPRPQQTEIASEHDTAVAVFAGVERRGTWTLPRRLQAVAIFGGMILDFREALFPPGVTDVHVTAVMGGVQLIVPPSLSVEVSGTAIMGGFGHVERVPAQFDPDRPVLRVHGMAVMGGVGVETRLPGEPEQEAHRRRRGERHALSPARRLPRI